MRTLIATAAVVMLAGCIDWKAFEANKNRKGTPINETAATAIEKRLRAEAPEWRVYRRDESVHATLRERAPAANERSISFDAKTSCESHLVDGSASLLDYLIIAREIARLNYRLPAWTGRPEGSNQEKALDVEPPLRARPDNLAARVHDLLVDCIERRTEPDACHATCEGSTTVCGQGRRSFARGVPCALGTEANLPSAWTRGYGYSWCAAAFCPAMRRLAREESGG